VERGPRESPAPSARWSRPALGKQPLAGSKPLTGKPLPRHHRGGQQQPSSAVPIPASLEAAPPAAPFPCRLPTARPLPAYIGPPSLANTNSQWSREAQHRPAECVGGCRGAGLRGARKRPSFRKAPAAGHSPAHHPSSDLVGGILWLSSIASLPNKRISHFLRPASPP
jgi:hypothetical protein